MRSNSNFLPTTTLTSLASSISSLVLNIISVGGLCFCGAKKGRKATNKNADYTSNARTTTTIPSKCKHKFYNIHLRSIK